MGKSRVSNSGGDSVTYRAWHLQHNIQHHLHNMACTLQYVHQDMHMTCTVTCTYSMVCTPWHVQHGMCTKTCTTRHVQFDMYMAYNVWHVQYSIAYWHAHDIWHFWLVQHAMHSNIGTGPPFSPSPEGLGPLSRVWEGHSWEGTQTFWGWGKRGPVPMLLYMACCTSHKCHMSCACTFSAWTVSHTLPSVLEQSHTLTFCAWTVSHTYLQCMNTKSGNVPI